MAGAGSTDTTTLPADLAAIAERVETRLRQLLSAERERWVALDPVLADPIDALAGLVLAGGKRLRPAFCHWGFVGAGGDPADPMLTDAGAAFEMLQGFALIHDDIMDGSSVRRGAPAVHRGFAGRHEAMAWSGEARRFGEGAAILVGDLALVYADQLLPEGPRALGELWDELRVELNVGQYLDLIGTVTRRSDRLLARRVARYKSGKYTIERPLHLGATLAGRNELTEPLSGYGDPLGEAFQLRDDVLGVFGDSTLTGKPVGDDLREGKPTMLLAVAHERATESQRATLDQVGDPDLDRAAVEALQQVLIDAEALSTVEEEIAALGRQATDALVHIEITEPARDALADLARFVISREK